MAHYKLMFPSKYIDAATLEGHDVVVEIESVRMETLEGEKGEKDTKPVVRLKGKKKLWVLNKTNAKIIARLYSNDVDGWIGKRITLYPTTCDAFGQHDIECVRVRKAAPGHHQEFQHVVEAGGIALPRFDDGEQLGQVAA